MQIVSMRTGICALAAAIALALAGCGGGGSESGSGGGAAAIVPGQPVLQGGGASTALPWTSGVFSPAAVYKDFCAAPRTGTDILGHAFPDKQGTLLQELFWLRSWTNETYLWNTEVVDQNPNSFSDRLVYFGLLKTTAVTGTGKPKDKFHFTLLTSDYLAQTNSAPTASYGAEIRVFASTPPRDVRVLYNAANSPAAALQAGTQKLGRGAKILAADGIDVVNGGATQADLDALNNALFPAASGQTHTFLVQNADGSQRNVTLTSTPIVENPVNRASVLTTPTGKVGYVLFNTFAPFSSEKALADTITAIKAQGANDLVLDLRYNGGGLLAVASQLAYEVAGSTRTLNHTFEYTQFNAAAGTRDPVTGLPNDPEPFFSTGLGFSLTNGTPLPTLNLPRVYILSTKDTCSASEAVINGLRGVDVDVVLVGGTTCGKPYGFYPQDNCGVTYFSIQFTGVNDKGFGGYADGFAAANSTAPDPVKIAGCSVADDLNHELGDTGEAMLAAALGHRATGTCPAPTGASLSLSRAPDDGPAIATSGRSLGDELMRNNRDMRLPNTVSGR